MVAMPQVSINTDLSDGLCFGCGHNNPIGLKLIFKHVGGTVRAEFTPGKLYQGWPGVIHGGIITCMLDEAMGHIARFTGRNCLTAKMEIKLRRSAFVGESLIITSSITRNTKRLIESKAEVCLQDGTLVAEGKATQFVIEGKSGAADSKEGESQSNA